MIYCIIYFRLRRTTFEYLLHVIGPDLQGDISDFGNFTISPEKQLLIALYVLGTPDSYRLDNQYVISNIEY